MTPLFNFSEISATKLEYRCHEEYYRMDPDLVREDSLLKGEQELFRQGGLFLDKGTAYTKPRGRDYAQGGAKCQDGSSTHPGRGAGAALSSAFYATLGMVASKQWKGAIVVETERWK